MEELEFYDVRDKKKFKSSDYRVEEREGKGGTVRYFAVTKSKTGPHECWRVLSKDQAAKMKDQSAKKKAA